MYSMNYIGKFIANFREFYNEINGATLTGAIDVVVVEQPDGSFTCSPFHVRFGKLGVLRSRFKVVDLELNGEPLNIHMKLGESGEAFFVEEVPEDETEWSAHLATSPIPDSRFDELYEPPIRRNSLSAADPLLEAHRPHNQISDYSQRRYTDGQKMEKPDFSKLPKEYHAHNEEDRSSRGEAQEHEALFEMEGLDEVGAAGGGWSEAAGAPRTFVAAEVAGAAQEVVRKISVHNDFRPIADAAADEPPQDEGKQNGKKKKKTKKAGSKKKHQRKSSSSSNQSSQSERAGSEVRAPPPAVATAADPTDINFFSDSELTNAALSDGLSKMNVRRIPLALSDTAFEISVVERHAGGGSRDGTPVQSDTEAELARGAAAAEKGQPAAQSWRWGELPEPPPRATDATAPAAAAEPLSSDEERAARRGVLGSMFSFMKSREEAAGASDAGVYLAELAGGRVDPDLYFPKQQPHAQHRAGSSTGLRVSLGGGASEEEYESGNGPSLPQSPASLDPPQLDSDDDDKLLTKGYVGVYVGEEGGGATVSRAVPYDEFVSSPGELLASPRLLVRVGDKYVPWAAAGPLLLSLLAYRRHLPRRVLESLGEGGAGSRGGAGARGTTPDAGAASKPRGYSWWSWRRPNPPEARAPSLPMEDPAQKNLTETDNIVAKTPEVAADGVAGAVFAPSEENHMPAVTEGMLPSAVPEEKTLAPSEEKSVEVSVDLLDAPVEEPLESPVEEKQTEVLTDGTPTETDVTDAVEAEEASQESTPLPGTEPIEMSGAGTPSAAEWEPQHPRALPAPRRHHRGSTDRFRKTLRLSSDQIASLNLKEGMNEMVFSVTTAYQGTTRCKCNLFRWRHDDKVVISDIDGTITKSDVLGHIFPLVGKDWAQSGVAQLFTKIKNNGYKLLYLSARAIGQAKVTREYLRSIRQGEVSLPDGPLLLNPTSLLRAFHREVIEKKPEEFKIQCLADIKALFPHDSNPFYAGYGNRVNDVCAYQAVGIPIVRIFTINYRGELKHELTQTFQSTYSHMSVLVDQVFPPVLAEPCDDFSQTVYWREPLPRLDLMLTLAPIPEAAH